MPYWVKGLVTIGLWALVPTVVTAAALAVGGALAVVPILLVGAVGLLYGLQAGILTIYDLNKGAGWAALIVDSTWSFVNTAFGFVIGNIVYIFFGTPSRVDSKDQSWIVYVPRSSTGFGHNVLQTLGTVNLGGAGQHEKMHLLQARIFGPLYLPLFAVSYVITFVIQVLWTITIGAVAAALKLRQKAYFRPPSQSAVNGFFGWIYYATPFEMWAYAVGNP